MSDYPPELSIEPQDTPETTLTRIQRELERLTREYAAGVINAAQFNAIYRHYSEKRTLIEKLIARNPESDAWRSAAEPHQTSFLREQLESRPLYYVVFRRGEREPLIADGKLSLKAAEQVHRMLQVIWAMQTWRKGLARKSMGDGMWMLLCIGDNALTMVIFLLQPSTLQTNQLRDMHEDFERANRHSLLKGLASERMVFPQRALMER
jgi:hypothetical protein